jgi:hypothetical protein
MKATEMDNVAEFLDSKDAKLCVVPLKRFAAATSIRSILAFSYTSQYIDHSSNASLSAIYGCKASRNH